MANHSSILPQKANISDLEDLEERLTQLISDLQAELGNYALKEETTKRFNQITKKIREIFELLSKQGLREDDGMLTKKNLGPVACANCERDLINLAGMPVDYHVWKGMPKRETNERIARYGKGFSRILSTLQDDSVPNASQTMLKNHVHDKMTLHHLKSPQVKPSRRASMDLTSPDEGYQGRSANELNQTTQATNYLKERHTSVQHDQSHNTTIGFFQSG